MKYPHHIRIFRGTLTSGGTQTDDGVWADDAGLDDVVEVFEGKADVQDGGEAVERDNQGSPKSISDAIVFPKDESKISEMKVGDGIEVTWEDGSKDLADITKIRQFDGTILIKRL